MGASRTEYEEDAMRRSRFSQEQIIGVLREQEAGAYAYGRAWLSGKHWCG
jgi:hypothetical protein